VTAEQVIAKLRARATELRQAGIRHVGLFGSLALECCLERICEAAVRLGDHAGQLVPNQPWLTSEAWEIRYGTPTTGSACR
jgi:hypothetical protein